MKKNYIFLISILMSISSLFSQTFQISSCDDNGDGIEIFDLTSLNSQITSTQPTGFSYVITFHLTEEDANNETNTITQPNSFSNDISSSIFVRIENSSDESYASYPVFLYVQNCPPGLGCPDTLITLSSQEDVDLFTTNYPSCIDLLNGFIISGSDIVDLSPLSEIKSISGIFYIQDNPELTNLNGLENINSITGGNMVIENNSKLANILGLSGLSGAVGHSIIIKDNPLLLSLQGLENVTNPGDDDLHIENNDSLLNLVGLSGMKHSDDLIISENDLFVSFEGFENFEFTGSFYLINNNSLISLSTLNSMNPLCGFEIRDNDVLEDLDGFIDEFSNECGPSIIITNNPNLSTCSSSFICDVLSQVAPYDPTVEIENNKTGCNNLEEILNICAANLLDDDSDGVMNGIDQCPNTLTGETVDSNGCSDNQLNIVNIPDINFKNALLNHNPVIDINNDGEIQVSEAILFNGSLSVSNLVSTPDNEKIADLTGIEEFVNITTLGCEYNLLTNIDLSKNVLLTLVYCPNNLLTSLDFSMNPLLIEVFCPNNLLTNLDISKNILLTQVSFWDNKITEIDFSNNINLTDIRGQNNLLTTVDISQTGNGFLYDVFFQNNKLTSMIIKNGFIEDEIHFDGNPDLEYICADEQEISIIQEKLNSYGYTECVVNSYCTFVPGGEFYSIIGKSILDIDNDGCDVSDPVFPNLKFSISDGVEDGEFVFDNTGNYNFSLQSGEYTITPILENSTYFSISPTSITVDFPTDTSPFNQDFCITPNGVHNDLEINIIPISQAKPGFDSNYKIIYKNKGSSTMSGTINFNFSGDIIDIITTNPTFNSQSSGDLTWNYTNLLPFESREISVVLNINSPIETPPVNDGDILNFTATINPVTDDETPVDNALTLAQSVVNSLDPNDKTCLEGNTITPDLIGGYVHYLIRCENTGSADAVNIVIKDEIDATKFDISTLFITDSSHNMDTKIDGNAVEFIFENIYLPFDDANNDAYVAFKIKTLPSLSIGDTFENGAEIFFDYNAPIITNLAQTSIQNALAVSDFEYFNEYIDLYPNPVENILYIKSKESINAIEVYDVSGRLIHTNSFIGTQIEIELNTQNLNTGIYFVKINTDKQSLVKKIIKN